MQIGISSAFLYWNIRGEIMTKEEYDSLGHITETGNCCICGKEYTDYGNSTWGIWTAEEEKMAFGENKQTLLFRMY